MAQTFDPAQFAQSLMAPQAPYDPGPLPPARPFAEGFESGVEGLKSSLAGAGAAVAGGFGAKTIEQRLLEAQKEYEARAGESARRVEDVSDLGSGVDYAKWALGNILPSSLSFMAAAAAGRGFGALATRNAALEATKQFARTAGAAAGGFGASMALETGQIYPNAVETGVEHPALRAFAGAVPAAALDFAPEYLIARRFGLFGKQRSLEGVLGKGGLGGAIKTAAKDAGVIMPLEGATEAGQSYIERLSAGQPTTGPEALSDYVNSFFPGLLGGTMTIPGSAIAGYRGPQAEPAAQPAQAAPATPAQAAPPGGAEMAGAAPSATPPAAAAGALPAVAPTAAAEGTPAGAAPVASMADARGERDTLTSKLDALRAELDLPAKEREKGRTKSAITKEIKDAQARIGDLDALAEILPTGQGSAFEQAQPYLAAQHERLVIGKRIEQIDDAFETAKNLKEEFAPNTPDELKAMKKERDVLSKRAAALDRLFSMVKQPEGATTPEAFEAFPALNLSQARSLSTAVTPAAEGTAAPKIEPVTSTRALSAPIEDTHEALTQRRSEIEAAYAQREQQREAQRAADEAAARAQAGEQVADQAIAAGKGFESLEGPMQEAARKAGLAPAGESAAAPEPVEETFGERIEKLLEPEARAARAERARDTDVWKAVRAGEFDGITDEELLRAGRRGPTSVQRAALIELGKRIEAEQAIPSGGANAGNVRSDQGGAVVEGQVEGNGGADRGGDVQRAPAGGGEANGAVLREQNEGVRGEAQVKKLKPKDDPFIRWILQNGGINAAHAEDIYGEKAFRANALVPRLFRKPKRNAGNIIVEGNGADDLVRRAVDAGWMPAPVLDDVDGGVQAFKDKVNAALHGERQIRMDNEDAVYQQMRDHAMRGVPMEDLKNSGYDALGKDEQEQVDYLLARFEYLFGMDELEALRERVALQTEGLSDEDHRTAIREALEARFQKYRDEADRAAASGEAGAAQPGGEGAGAEGNGAPPVGEAPQAGVALSEEDQKLVDEARGRLARAQQSGNPAAIAVAQQRLDITTRNAEAYARARAAYDREGMVELKDPERNVWGAVLPDMTHPGKFRVQFYDTRGISGHDEHDTLEQALRAAVTSRYTQVDQGAMDRLQNTPEFVAGMEAAFEVQRQNQEMMRASGERKGGTPLTAEEKERNRLDAEVAEFTRQTKQELADPAEPISPEEIRSGAIEWAQNADIDVGKFMRAILVKWGGDPELKDVNEKLFGGERPALDLAGETNEEILRKEEAARARAEAAAKAEAEAANAGPVFRGDQIDLFHPQGGLFDRVDQSAGESARNNEDTAYAVVGAVADEQDGSSAHIAPEDVERQSPASPEGPSQAEQPRDDYTADLFGNSAPSPEQRVESVKRQIRKPQSPSEIAGGKFATVASPMTVGSLSVGVQSVNNAGDAAHVLASLRKATQEKFMVLALDANNRPVGVLRLFYGGMKATTVHTEEFAKAVYQTPGVAKVWFAHNHPSGVARPSGADMALTKHLSNLLGTGMGIQVEGHVVIGTGRFAVLDEHGVPQGQALDRMGEELVAELTGGKAPEHNIALEGTPIPAHARKFSVPIIERTVKRAGRFGDVPLSDPVRAAAAINELLEGKEGVLFLDPQNRPVGTLEMSAAEMANLRGGFGDSNGKRFFMAAAKANAAAFMLNLGKVSAQTTADAALRRQHGGATLARVAILNMGSASRASEITLLDAFEDGKSIRNHGENLGHGKTFFSRDPVLSAYDERALRYEAIGQEVGSYLSRVLGASPDLSVEMIEQQQGGFAGAYRTDGMKDIIQIAFNAADPMSVAAHEGFHRIENRHLVGSERSIVRRAFEPGQPLFKRVVELAQQQDAQNGTTTADDIQANPAEARAYGFQYWKNGQIQANGPVGRIFEKIARLLERIRNFISGYGFKSVDDIFEAIDRGAYAKSDTSVIVKDAGEMYSQWQTLMHDLYAAKFSKDRVNRARNITLSDGRRGVEIALTRTERAMFGTIFTSPNDLADMRETVPSAAFDGERLTVAWDDFGALANYADTLSKEGDAPPSFRKFAFPPMPEMLVQYSHAALTMDSLADLSRRAQAGEIPHTQLMQRLAAFVDAADAPKQTYEKLFGANKEAFKGGLSRAYLSNFSTGNNIARQSKGYKNVFDVISAYTQAKNKFVADNLDIGLSLWKPWDAKPADAEAASRFIMTRTSNNWKLGSTEYQSAYAKLTKEQREMVDQANTIIPKMLAAEFESEKPGYRAVLSDEDYSKWESGRAAQIQRLVDEGYVPERRYGNFGVSVTIPVTKDGKTEHMQLRYDLFESQREQELWYQQLVGTEKEPGLLAGLGLKIEKGIKFKPEYDASISFKQFLDMADRHGIALTQVEKEKLAKALISADSTRRNRIFQRKNIPGYSEDGTRVLAEFVTNISNKMAYAQYGNAMQDALQGKRVSLTWDASTQKAVPSVEKDSNVWQEDGFNSGFYHAEAEKMVNAVVGPQQSSNWSRIAKMVATMSFLGGNIAFVPVQLTSVPINVVPYLYKSTGYANAWSKAMSSLSKTLSHNGVLFDLAKLSDKANKVDWVDKIDGLRDALIRAGHDGTTFDTELYQLMGMTRGGMMSKSRMAQRAVEAWMYPFKWSEKANRVSTFAAAYQVGKENGLAADELYRFAQQAVYDTQIRYDMANRPAVMRNPIYALLFTFKTYPIAMMELFVHLYRAKPMAAAAMLGSLWMMAGVNGMPLREDMMDLIDTIAQRIFGSPFNSQRWMRNHLKNASEAITGADFSGVMMNGIINSFTDLNMQSRVGLHNLIPGTRMFARDADWKREAVEMLGPLASQAIGMGKGVADLRKGDFVQLVRDAGPTAAQNVVKAMEQYQHGYAMDGRGQKLVDVSGWNIFLQSMGFSNATLSNIYDLDRIDKQTAAFYVSMRADLMNDIVKGIRDGDREKVADTFSLIAKWNEAHPDMVMAINPGALRKEIRLAGMPLNQRTLMMLPKRLRAGSEAAGETLER